jgi:hypothetical protein
LCAGEKIKRMIMAKAPSGAFFLHISALVTFSQLFYGNNNQKRIEKMANFHKKLVIFSGFYCENVLKCRIEFGENSEGYFVYYIGGILL